MSVDVTLARIEEKLDAALKKGDDHENRIRKLEGWRAHALGIVVGITFIFAFIKDALTGFFTKS